MVFPELLFSEDALLVGDVLPLAELPEDEPGLLPELVILEDTLTKEPLTEELSGS